MGRDFPVVSADTGRRTHGAQARCGPNEDGGLLPLLFTAKNEVIEVPIGKVKWFDAGKGFGFLATDEGQEVFLHASALPAGVAEVKPGTRMEFGVAEGKRGPQALSARILEAPPSVAKATRKDAEDMAVITEDLIKLLDGISNGLRRGRYPDRRHAAKVAAVLRAVADDLDV